MGYSSRALADDQHEAELLASVFEERAENLSRSELEQWTAESPRDRDLLAKLTGPGAKLLSGPRGSGKSTLLKRAYYALVESGSACAAYVNYSRSLALEPLFHRRPDALQLFRQWVLYKIVLGVSEYYSDAGTRAPRDLRNLARAAKGFIHSLEVGRAPGRVDQLLSPSELLALIEKWNPDQRTVLLLDDAAHAFSPEQQREFFEIFRELRSRSVAAKAAVYPGVTSYSPLFQVGHEAQVIEAWHDVDDPQYLDTMRKIFELRIPPRLRARLAAKEELLDYLALASFGLPRGFLVMLSQLLGVEEDESARPSRQLADKLIAGHAASVRAVFGALKGKLPRYRNLIDVGAEFERATVNALKAYNANKSPGRKAKTVAVQEPVERELGTILNLLQYAGLVRRLDDVSRGVKGRFQRYQIHFGLLIAGNALNLGRSPSVQATIDSLTRQSAHAFVRARGASLLGDDFQERCRLDLAPCQNCGAARPSEDARFCVKCGRQLTNSSIYEELLGVAIDALPLTANKLAGIRRHTNIRTVQDVLLDEDTTSLRSVPYIGPVWAARIRNYAQEFVGV